MSVPPFPTEGTEHHDEICHRCFILSPDPRDDPAFALNSYNKDQARGLGVSPLRRAGYLGDVEFFNRERDVGLEDDEETIKDDCHDDAFFDNATTLGDGVNHEL
jgi:hypothetical protein